jgi:hypothetical protein
MAAAMAASLSLALTRPMNAAGEDFNRYTSHSGADRAGRVFLPLRTELSPYEPDLRALNIGSGRLSGYRAVRKAGTLTHLKKVVFLG